MSDFGGSVVLLRLKSEVFDAQASFANSLVWIECLLMLIEQTKFIPENSYGCTDQ